jgi:hypothetical protein
MPTDSSSNPISSNSKSISLFADSANANSNTSAADDTSLAGPVRRRSSSFDIPKESEIPPYMQIIGCINEDGLGLTQWW